MRTEKRKVIGSETFGTHVIKTDEYVLMAGVMKENQADIQTISNDLELIDDLLAMQRMQCVIQRGRFTASGRIRKNASLQDMISARLDQHIEEIKTQIEENT